MGMPHIPTPAHADEHARRARAEHVQRMAEDWARDVANAMLYGAREKSVVATKDDARNAEALELLRAALDLAGWKITGSETTIGMGLHGVTEHFMRIRWAPA
jgi:hypothetical protein